MEAIVTLPDGRRAKITGPNREAILQQVQQMSQPGDIIPNGQRRPLPAEERLGLSEELLPGLRASRVTGGSNDGALEALVRSGAESITGAVAGVPNVLANVARRVPAQLGLTPPQNAPSLADPVIPTPSGRQIVAGAETALEAPVAAVRGQDVNLSQMFGRNMDDAEALAQEHPVADFLGQGAALAVGRTPIARARATQQRAVREAAEAEAKRRLDLIPDEIKDELGDVVSRKVVPALKEIASLTKRGTKRAAETGIEGATLAVLQQGDPESMFWYGAGSQAAGSLALTLATRPVKGLLPFVAGTWLASEAFKAVTPGDQNFFESKDFAVQKMIALLGLGAVAGLSGMGRLRNKTAERFPAALDAITSLPRGAILSRLQELTNNAQDNRELPLRVMEKITRNPEAFNRDVMNSLNRAFMSEKEGAFTKEVERLMKESKAFREAMSQ